MTSDRANEHRASMLEEIRLILVEALRTGMSFGRRPSRASLRNTYPDSGLTEAQISAGLFEAAVEAGVLVDKPSQVELLRSALKRTET